ncbi:MAG TPA: arginase family protein [Egibacteraceae bacterium]
MRRRFDLWGVPFDGAATLGWPGSRYAPAEVRKALAWMKMRTEDGRVYSLDTGAVLDIGDDLLTDRGDAAVIASDLTASLDACSAAVADSVRAGRVPIVVGGDDSLLFACVRGFHDAVEGSVGVVHFDAHLDLMDSNVQQGRYSQSSGMRRSLELERVRAEHCIQVGLRHFNFPSSAEVVRAHDLAQITAVEYQRLGTEGAVARIRERIAGADHVFFSFDIDAVDPAHAPGAGAHEPGGLTSREALDCVRALAPHCGGFAITEVNPLKDVGGMTATLAAYLVYSFAVYGSVGA